MQAWSNPGKWSVNPINFSEGVRAEFELPQSVFVLDSTLRKMTETPGCRWSVAGARDIAAMADEVGVTYMVVNIVHGLQPPSRPIKEMFAAVAGVRRRFKLFGTAWPFRESINLVADLGGDGVDIAWGELAAFADAYDYADSRGLLVAKELSRGSRLEHMPPSGLAQQINLLLERDLAYIGLHDNTNATSPEGWRYYVKQLRKALVDEAPLVPHVHNLLGQATAATCAAVTGGARGIDVTANGIAASSGLAALEETVVALEAYYGVQTGIELTKLRAYSQVVSEATGLPVHPNKPLVGDDTFIVELDMFVREVLEARLHKRERVHAIAPSLVGHEYTLVWGFNTIDQTGATQEKLFQMGLPNDEATASRVNDAIRAALNARERGPLYLIEPDFETLAREVVKGRTHGDHA
jgi:isopropylmalate/homocitrate/citramalate synthase